MKIFSVKRTYHNLVRIKEILQVLTKHGFGHIVSQLNIPSYIPGLRNFGILKSQRRNFSQDTVPARLRMAFQELGPTFVKLGQILSGRPDIFNQKFIQEFKQLQDNVSPFSTEEVFTILNRELHAPVDEIFAWFDEEVLASGSIGQVHRACLPDGKEVIIKIKRPGIDNIIFRDIDILQFLAELVEKYVEELKILRLPLVVEEFARSIRKELDFNLEASYCEKFYDLLQNNPHVSSPRVFWEYTSSDIITLERLRGINIGEKQKLQAKNIDLKALTKHLISSFMQQYFIWGLFHGDPHPGNILVTDEGKIQLIDFGLVGHLSNELKGQLSTIVLALVRNDVDMIIECYADIGIFQGEINTRELKTDILEILDKYVNTPFQHLDLKRVFHDLITLAHNHQVMLPRDFVLVTKSLVTITSLAKELDPDFNIAKAAAPHISSILREKLSPNKVFRMGIFNLWSMFTLLQKFPSEMKGFLRRFKAGDIRIIVKHESLDKYTNKISQTGNNIAMSIVVAALILSTSMVTTTQMQNPHNDMTYLVIAGYIISLLLGLGLIAGMQKSNKM